MIDLRVSEREMGRLLAVVRERRRKLERGLTKFADDFDPIKGANMRDSHQAYAALDQALTEAMNATDNSRGAGRDPRQHQGRRDAPGDYRPARR
jgi:hypothetical protein